MASLATQYHSGDHQAVWRALDQDDGSIPHSVDDIEDVMHQTFTRVAHNTDLLITRLRDTGYRFESEAGRDGPAYPPRRLGGVVCANAKAAVEDRFGDLPTFQTQNGPFPMALTWFANIVGSVDLRQRYPAVQPMDIDEIITNLPDDISQDRTGLWTEELQESMAETLKILESMIEGDPVKDAHMQALFLEDLKPHPHSHDPVIARLGDWDPFEMDFDYLDYMLTEDEAEMYPLAEGGIVLLGEFAASFEHKANVSGAINPAFHFPSTRYDPIVHSEGIKLPFTTYLRRIFARGGFYGIPRPTRPTQILDHTVELGIYLPDHPIFTSLTRDLLAF